MNTYIVVSFWMLAAGVSLRIIELATVQKWPRESKTSLGMQLAVVLINSGFAFWAGYLLWWGPR